MALLDIFRLQREVSMMCLSSAALSFLGRPLRLWSSRCPFLCASSKELGQHTWKPLSALKFLPRRDLADAV
uniref:Uncharacterized protein n=1 Tax=Anguilla anguilla TaxID=7936 RepID=A0A0E9PHW5_ANGAN